MSLFSLRNVSFRYPSQTKDALHEVTCDIEEGEFVALLGADGSGKTTFAKLLNGIIPHVLKGTLSGEVLFRGTPTTRLQMTELVREVGLTLQDPDVQLFLDSIEEELAFGPENLGIPPAEIENRIARALEIMEITDIRTKSPKTLSGGQKQRLVIASILTMGTRTIILDEALSMLDQAVKKELLRTLRRMSSEEKMTVIITSQDAEDIYQYCDKMILLSRGRLACVGRPREILRSSSFLTSLGIEPPQILEAIDRAKAEGLTGLSDRLYDAFISQLSESREARIT